MKLSNDVNITSNNENSINDTAPNTAEQTWSTAAAKKIPRRGAIKKRWMYVGRVAENKVSESDILAYMDNIPNFETIDIKKLPTKGSNSAYWLSKEVKTEGPLEEIQDEKE
ncbi:hypothetical protein WA026_005325 [Henosepilachna vigintioctopunctata]|uniref:Uncharacterized protein n=1 Tax=Henosepilachna vigintioctopunctata TaxID=420089 RepID=A0AAW1UWP7_9CUCU